MNKVILAALAVLFALSTPALASIIGSSQTTIHQEEGGSQPEQPSGEGEGGGGGGGGGGE